MKSKLQLIIPILLIGFSILVPIIVINFDNSGKNSIDFETIAQGAYGYYPKHDYIVIDSQIEWEQIWEQTFHSRAFPVINFTISTVIAVYFGFHATGGYVIEITKIKEATSEFYVYVEETHPGSGIVTQATTLPYHIIKTQKLTKDVIFECKSLINY